MDFFITIDLVNYKLVFIFTIMLNLEIQTVIGIEH